MTIAPSDAVVAAKSFPRRWRALFARAAGDDDAPDVLERSGAVELAAQAAVVLHETGDRVLGRQPSVVISDEKPLDELDRSALHLADAIDHVDAELWAGVRIEALTAGIDEAAGLLRQAEAAIEEARRQRS